MQKIDSKFVVCVENREYTASLELRKIYEVILDSEAESHGMVRLVDESGEDYLYPSDFFMAIELPDAISHALEKAS